MGEKCLYAISPQISVDSGTLSESKKGTHDRLTVAMSSSSCIF